jgi:flavin reductase (DIM6/NTAB) family NADH-FMN oxidoreductase RutF
MSYQLFEDIMVSVLTAEIGRDLSSGDFRAAMRRLAGGVSVITAGRDEDITGMTVTSVSVTTRTRCDWPR